MEKDLIASLKRISMTARYALEHEVAPHTEIAKTLTYIIEEVLEALAKAQGTAS